MSASAILAGMSEKTSKPVAPGDLVYLIDGSGYIFRAYHALPPLTRSSDGLPVGAVQGFCSMLNKLLREMENGARPSHLAVIFDKSGKSFRNEIYPEYKAHRPPAPEDLVPQFALIRQAVEAFNVPSVEQDNYEADDIIATYAKKAEKSGAEVRIVSSDKDLMQLVSDRVTMFDSMKNKLVGPEGVVEKFGVPAEKVVDVQALAGDSVDNVPGVPGIGIKTGALLINQYGDLETLLSRADEIKQPKRRQNLIEFADQARLSRRLVLLEQNVPVHTGLDAFTMRDSNPEKLVGFLKAMEFNQLTQRICKELAVDADSIEPANIDIADWQPLVSTIEEASDNSSSIDQIPINPDDYETVTSLQQLAEWMEMAKESGVLCVDTETNSLDTMQAELVGVALATAPGKACYIPLQHRASEGLLLEGQEVEQIELAKALEILKPVLEDESILKIAQNMKYDFVVLKRYGIEVAPFDDTMLLSYALDSGRGSHGMDELSKRHLGHTPIPYKQIAGSGKSARTFDLVPVNEATRYAAEDADVTFRLWQILKPRLAKEHRATVYETLERPLVAVLADMEMQGILVDRMVLSRLSGEFAVAAEKLKQQAHELAGEKFNPGSPKQLGEILFGKMGLEGGRKTGTGAWSTDVRVMEDLARDGVELAQIVLDWRQLSKLKSTYTDALIDHINPDTGRVHTSYSMAATSTGRLASSDPNLQNIPIRSQAGRKIRKSFIADKGNKLVSADYSQIELRLLAHIADIGQLKQAFADGLDIHAMTASEVFDVPLADMDPEVRRRAKAINFGIIYGISAFGLANQLNISRSEASDYIKTYFERFPGIRDYMEDTKAFARSHGYVETIFGRRCHFPKMMSSNANEKAFQERAAINAPIQGSAADIIRRAMIRMPDALSDAKLQAKMLLQVHDELVFETPEDEAERLIGVVVDIMENAALPACNISVALKVDAHAADNWDDAH